MAWDDERVDRFRESARSGLATALAATARGLATASKAVAATASQLRPPEGMKRSRSGSDAPAAWRPSAPAPAAAREAPGASDAPTASPDAVAPPDAAAAPASAASPTASAAPAASAPSAKAPAAGSDVAALVERNARDVIAEVSDLSAADLRRLREAEAQGKARKTVLAAIDRALEG